MQQGFSINLSQSNLSHSPTRLRPRLAIPLGDPAGIGPEIVLKAIAHPTLHTLAQVTLVGHAPGLAKTLSSLRDTVGLDLDLSQIPLVEAAATIAGLDAIELGQPTEVTGHASFCWLNRAITGALQGEFDAVVTAPIAKSVWHAAGHLYPGQTEVLAERAEVDRFGMLFAARSPHTGWPLRCLLATTHIPLQQVPTVLTPELMTHKLDLLVACLQQDFGLSSPHIAIAGLNPHSGEAGKLGTEEVEWLQPWLTAAQQRYPQVKLTGLIPPDTMWVSAGHAWHTDRQASPFDAYLALYHDQGLIPVKLLAFDRAVNTTIGLPFVRTSPDHGTAFDIAGKGIARSDSMEAAIALAIELVQQRKHLSSREN
ncbi:4-hydroxythreonine-4-phosphate dehydrogenase PdxA [Leptolyngbya iicbica]|uniref:4-hydroxythreonine-4-phosphate dehydrogenase n=2 Tax=Cyanophyceae TaxID=3028117 RepID=A0A4Q7EB17_9CYAN|nr:4-hydroxythreonine-4-phosphate dehydrogenase PdxA [Leptolyngbya sp. LK]RZM79694.1 4-hydroxythreonine-4-phosphate dehydrogenase PdxA [Leptolyngbya sp. LK]